MIQYSIVSQVAETNKVATEPERQNSSTEKKKPSLEAYVIAEQAANEEISVGRGATLKQYYINLMSQLEIEGFPKTQISTIGRQIILEKKIEKLKDTVPINDITVGSWWFDVAREQGCIDPFYSHGDDDKNKKVKPPTKYEIENNEWIAAIERLEDFFKTAKMKFRNEPVNSLIPQKESNQYILHINQMITHANDRLNGKTKIAPSHYAILIDQAITLSGMALSLSYYEHVKKKEEFTKKQYQKIVNATMEDEPYEYEPTNRDHAKACGFSGIPCPNCDCFRTEYINASSNVIYEDLKGNKFEHGIKTYRIKCHKENKEYDAPIPVLNTEPIIAAEISQADW